MAVFVLVPGAGGNASYWSRLVPELEARGHRAIAVDLPEDDPGLGLGDWARLVDAAAPGEGETVPLAMIVLLNAMIPAPGEAPDDWWDNTGSGEAMRAAAIAAGREPEFDLERHFLHDLDEQARAALFAEQPREPSGKAMADRCSFDRWPDTPTKVLVGRDDRFFPVEFQRRIAGERLGLEIDAIPGGHLVAVANPALVADRLVDYLS